MTARRQVSRRVFDLVLAGCALVVLSPLLLLTALIVAVTSKGPIFFRAKRAGIGGHPFIMHKFRTMTAGSEAGAKVTAPGDNRLVPGARFIRAAKLDELPQLFNILAGQMSIVGPRPEDPEIVKTMYGPDEHKSLEYPPGLTSPGSLWYYQEGEQQLAADNPIGNYKAVMAKKLAMDVAYFEKATLLDDVILVFKTVFVILRVSFRGLPGSQG